MPQYRSGFTPEQYDALKATIGPLAAAGPFDANHAPAHVLDSGVTNNAGDVDAILGDLVDLGYLQRLPDAGGPHRYELAAGRG
jgi:hypothetical protein